MPMPRNQFFVKTGVVGHKVITTFIQVLRYTVAILHHQIFGRRAPIPSPHPKQGLPFGQTHLTLSIGQVIQVPSMTRTLINRSQCTQYVHETGFLPFSQDDVTYFERMQHISEKVPSGLNYYAREGTRAFADLLLIVHKLKEWD